MRLEVCSVLLIHECCCESFIIIKMCDMKNKVLIIHECCCESFIIIKMCNSIHHHHSIEMRMKNEWMSSYMVYFIISSSSLNDTIELSIMLGIFFFKKRFIIPTTYAGIYGPGQIWDLGSIVPFRPT